jgi:HlyD family secretion protein
MKIPRKIVLYTVPVALIAAFAIALRPSPLPVDLAAVERGPLRVTLEEEGETRVRERFVVSAPFAGRVLRIEMEPGESVRAGETLLATLRPGTPSLIDARSRASLEARVGSAEAALARARAERERSRAELRFAESDLKRQKTLGNQGIVSRETVESAELGVDTRRATLAAADSEIQAAQHELEAARAALLETGAAGDGGATSGIFELRAPVDGVVLRRLRESESVVAAGDPLVEVGDPRDLEIVADLLSTDAAQLRPGHRVEIEQWGGGEVLQSRVRRIEPSGFTKVSALGVEEQRVWVVMELIDPPERRPSLGDGFRVEVRVVLQDLKDVPQIPTSALFRDEAGWKVFAVDNGKAVRRAVEIGHQNGLAAEVRSGLKEGDQVILHPSADVKEGAEVQGREGSPQTSAIPNRASEPDRKLGPGEEPSQPSSR